MICPDCGSMYSDAASHCPKCDPSKAAVAAAVLSLGRASLSHCERKASHVRNVGCGVALLGAVVGVTAYQVVPSFLLAAALFLVVAGSSIAEALRQENHRPALRSRLVIIVVPVAVAFAAIVLMLLSNESNARYQLNVAHNSDAWAWQGLETMAIAAVGVFYLPIAAAVSGISVALSSAVLEMIHDYDR